MWTTHLVFIACTKAFADELHDWGMLAYAVGFGGSMIWFGSSAGVALSNLFPESRSVGAWIRQGWHVAVAYPLGFFVLLWLLGWQPEATRTTRATTLSGIDNCAAIGGAASWKRLQTG